MNILTYKKIKINAAGHPKANPFSDFTTLQHNIVFNKEEFPGEEIYPLYGLVKNNLPYSQQDFYTREIKPRDVNAVILENDCLRAIFLPDYGCRLWSLYHKKKKRELLYKNPYLIFGNLAIRNAWTAGGVEWNLGWMGHTPFTSDTVFCEEVADAETGVPVLRFYEYERKRGIFYEVDTYLPDGSEFLMVRVLIKNPTEETVPIYWWSNIAVPEEPKTRVVTDADKAFHHHPHLKKFIMADILHYDGTTDVTYPVHLDRSVDFFFKVPKPNRKFIASLDKNGCGLVQTSTDALRGRKLFLWGTHPGGGRWQSFLSDGTGRYVEIQAGLAHSQMESIPVSAGDEVEWLEAYGHLEAEPEKIHSSDWEAAKAEAKNRLETVLPRDLLEKELERTKKTILGIPGRQLCNGSGWGALENLFRKKHGQPMIKRPNFHENSLTYAQEPWCELLQSGTFTPPEALSDISAYAVSDQKWIPLLLKAAETSDNWFVEYHLALIYFANSEVDKAKERFIKSAALKKTVWAYHALSQLEESEKACDYMNECMKLAPMSYWLAKSAMELYNQYRLFEKSYALYHRLPTDITDTGRLKLLYAAACLGLKKTDECAALLSEPFEVADLRECELTFHELWFDYITQTAEANGETFTDTNELLKKYPIPAWMDFKMN